MDALRPPFDVEELPEGPPNTAGQFERFTQEQFVSPWHDQNARMLKHLALSFSNTAGQTIEVPEPPLWYLFTLHIRVTIPDGQASGDYDFPVTIQQGVGESAIVRPVPSAFVYYDTGLAASKYLNFYGPMSRIILKPTDRHVALSVATTSGLAVQVRGRLWLTGAGVDPTKVGQF